MVLGILYGLFLSTVLASVWGQNKPFLLDPTFSDSGTFQIRQGHHEIGREIFRIHWEEDKIIAEADITLKHQRADEVSLHTRLVMDIYADVISYSAKTTGGGPQRALSVTFRDRIAICETKTNSRSESTPVIVDPGFLLLDTNVFHHYIMLVQRLIQLQDPSNLEVFIPQAAIAGTLQIKPAGRDKIKIGKNKVSVLHYKLNSGQVEISVWLDQEGKLYRIRVPKSKAEVTRIE